VLLATKLPSLREDTNCPSIGKGMVKLSQLLGVPEITFCSYDPSSIILERSFSSPQGAISLGVDFIGLVCPRLQSPQAAGASHFYPSLSWRVFCWNSPACNGLRGLQKQSKLSEVQWTIADSGESGTTNNDDRRRQFRHGRIGRRPLRETSPQVQRPRGDEFHIQLGLPHCRGEQK
jgi:hypothetical protein